MPASDQPPAARSGYSDPRTPHGVALTELSREAGGFFVLHEVGWLPRGLQWHFPRVFSPFWRLYHNPRPGWKVRHRDRLWPLDPDRLLLIPDGTVFDCEGEAGVPHLWIHFGMNSPLRHPPAQPLSLPLTPPLRALIRQLVTRLRTAADVRATGHTASALLHEAVANFNPSTLATVPEKTASLLAFIAKNPEATLSNAVLAKYAGLSEGAFIRWFHAEVGTTPAVHVQQMRMKTAAHALLTTSRSIEDIASSVGFKNRHHFTRLFRQHFHLGPATYRKK
jgi:AraC-like DNA-binding protein